MRHVSAGIAALALVLAACDAPTRTTGPAAPPRPDAAVVNTQFKVDFAFAIDNPCDRAHEIIDVTGSAHMGFQSTVTPNGAIELHTIINSQDFLGVGRTTGTRYRFTLIEHSGFRQNFDAASNDLSMETSMVVSQGPGDNFTAFTNMHVTFNANGEPTAEVVDFRTECTG